MVWEININKDREVLGFMLDALKIADETNSIGNKFIAQGARNKEFPQISA